MNKKIILATFVVTATLTIVGGSALAITGSVHLVYPSLDQCYQPGSTVNIYWDRSTDINHVALYFSPNGFNTRPSQYFYMSTSGQANYYAWTVPPVLTNEGAIWVVAHGADHAEGVSDRNDMYFRIATNCLLSPTPTPIISLTPTPTPSTTAPTPTPTSSSLPTAPVTPSGLNYTVLSSNSIMLSWNPSLGATSYKLWRLPVWDNNQSWKQFSSPTATDTNLVTGTTYRYTVTAMAGISGTEYQSAQSSPIYVYIPGSNTTTSPTPTPSTSSTPTPTPNSSPTPTPAPTPIYGSYLNVITVDNQGHVVPYAGVVVNGTDTAGTNTTGAIAETSFWKTNANGQVQIPVKTGTHLIRASLPPENGYLNPAEQNISINTGEVKEVKLVFIKKETVFAIYIKGITRLDDGRPTDAFVWAWSDKGRSASIRSNLDGTFSLQISPDDKWHIGAGRSINEIPYKASEITVPVIDKTVFAELILTKATDTVTLSSTTNTRPATEIITTQTGDGAKITIPAYSTQTTTNLTVEVKPTVEVPSQPSARVLGAAYDIKVRDQAGSNLTQFNNLIEVELPYDPTLLSSQNLTEDKMTPSYYDDSTGTWVKITNFTIDKTRKVIIAKVDHLTVFAIVLAADIVPPTPPSSVQVTALGNGQIRLTWINPSGFSLIKIYRSEGPSSLGRLETTLSTGTSYTNDADIVDGVTYYYVIRAVDSAGNETSNTTPVSIKAIGNSTKSSTLKDGDMISAAGSSDPDIYIVNSSTFKRLFLNPAIFNFYGHLGGFVNVKSVTSTTRDSYKTSGLFRNCETNDPQVYGVEITGEDTGALHWVNTTGQQAVQDDPDFFKKVFCINNNEFNWYKKGSSYSSVNQIPNYSR